MILHTVMPLELVLEGLEENALPKGREIIFKGIPVWIEDCSEGKIKLKKILSSNPRHYLIMDKFLDKEVALQEIWQ